MAECEDGSLSAIYVRGVNLVSRLTMDGVDYYLHDAHGDVIALTDGFGAFVKSYDYDAFGNEKNPDESDTNPFRYCGEYFDKETKTYYLRARYYDPAIGRFTQQDTHWSPANMIYGDNPRKIYEGQDALGLSTCTYAPEISAIMQSGNLYVYCMNNPVLYADSSGNLAFLIVTGLIGAVVGGIIGAVHSYETTGDISWKSVGTGALVGGLLGFGIGAMTALMLAGSATASLLAVSTGFSTLTAAISSGGLTAGGAFLLENIHNASAQCTVLGHNPGYLELAKKIGARVFSIPTEIWQSLTRAQQWALNQEFLDVSIAKGHEFIFSTNVYQARVGSFLYSEIQYLLSNGYRIVDEGWRMIR